MAYNEGTLVAGQVVRMVPNGPPYRVEYVNPSRAFCVPIRGTNVQRGGLIAREDAPDIESGSRGINIASRAFVEILEGDPAELLKQARFGRKAGAQMAQDDQVTNEGAANEGHPTEETQMSVSAIPVRSGSGGGSTRDREKARRAAVSSRKAAAPRKLSGAAAKAKARAAANGGAKAKTVRKCACGCGEDTASWFAPGHDGRWHGWANKLADGRIQPEDVPRKVRDAMKLKKTSSGFKPTVNYNGEAYTGH